MGAKEERQARLLEIVLEQKVATQAELASLLRKAGFRCTQVSISRDIHDLRLVKKDGMYAVQTDSVGDDDMPPPDVLKDQMSGFLKNVATAGANLVVILTLSGTAMGVALYLDHCGWPGVVGTVAGDDTVFVAVTGRQAQKRVVKRLRRLAGKAEGGT